jgi:hypothetical protein
MHLSRNTARKGLKLAQLLGQLGAFLTKGVCTRRGAGRGRGEWRRSPWRGSPKVRVQSVHEDCPGREPPRRAVTRLPHSRHNDRNRHTNSSIYTPRWELPKTPNVARRRGPGHLNPFNTLLIPNPYLYLSLCLTTKCTGYGAKSPQRGPAR